MDPRPRIAILYDVPNWAFHNIANNIAKIGRDQYQFDLLGHDDWFGCSSRAANLVASADVIVFLWRFDLIAFLDTLDADAWDKITAHGKPAFVTIVYDHLYMAADDMRRIGDPFRLSDVVAACSDRLQVAYAAQAHLPDPSFVAPDGVDLTRFTPANCDRPIGQPLRIGWVGNSAMGRTVEVDLKGKDTIFDPAIVLLASRGLSFETRVADRATRPVSSDDMPAFYRGIDVLVCSSSCEGTPNPLLEAMASGVAVVTTDVGLTRDVLGPIQSEFILKERSVHCLADALERLIHQPEMVVRMQQENIVRRVILSWESRWPIWQNMIETARRKVAEETGHRDARQRAFADFRHRRRSTVERIRRVVVQNRAMYRSYVTIREHCPGAIRVAKRVFQWARA